MKSSRRNLGWPVAPAAALACAVALSGCSSDGGGDWLTILKVARDSWDNRDAPVELNDAAAIPYSTLGVRINGGHEQILILAIDANGERLWTSAAHLAFTTRRGRIVRTAGLGTDLSGYSGTTGDFEDWTRPHSYSWSGDFADLGVFSAPISCDVRPAGPDPITILGKQFDTIRVDETCHSEKLDWTFTNSYWVNPQSLRVWRALAHIHPRGPAIEFEMLRPPLSPG